MPDYGAKMADRAIADIESKLRSSYGTAQRELRQKLRDFNARFAAKDREKRQQLNDGKITKQEYADWKAGQVFQRGQWEEKVREVSRVMSQTNEQAMRIVNDGRLDVFSENYNYMAFLGEKQTGVSFNIYNTQAVARLIQDDPQVLPEWKIDEEKDYTWNYQKVNNIVQQGIIQGESIEGMTKRLCTDLATQNENRMRMFARTAITGAQNAGRQAQMEDAASMGLEVHKQWLATMDAHTRSLHRDRDGEEVPYNEDFSGGLEYPGDPAGDPEDVYNCRCTMISVYPEHAAHHDGGPRLAYGEEDEDGYRESYLTAEDSKEYKEWKTGKQERGEIVEPKTGKPKEGNQTRARESKNRVFDVEKATNIAEIAEHMVSDGIIEKSPTLDGIDLECAKAAYKAFKRVRDMFPWVTKEDLRLEASDLGSNTYADCAMYNDGRIRLNRQFFGNLEKVKRQYYEDLRTNFHPMGTTWESIIYHEIGHRVDAIIDEARGTYGAYSKRMFKECLNQDKSREWLPFRETDVRGLVSDYATKDEREWFAECFAVMMTVEDKDKSSMQRVYEQLFNEAVRRYLR